MYKATYQNTDSNAVSQSDQISEHLFNAAKIITDFFVTPSNLLDFISKTIWRIDNYRIMKEEYSRDVHSYFENMMIDEIVQPWLKNKGDVQLKIAQGLKKIGGYFEGEYSQMVQLIEKAYDNYADEFEPDYNEIKQAISSIQTLYKIGELLIPTKSRPCHPCHYSLLKNYQL